MTGRDSGHIDAPLSERGRRQAAGARARLDGIPLELVATSPLTRALQTTFGIFADHSAHPPIVVEALHRECQESSCDIGWAASELARDFLSFSVGHLPEIWWHVEGEPGPEGYHIEPRGMFESRVTHFRSSLRARPERVIAVVEHGTFFHRLTRQQMANCEVLEVDLSDGRRQSAVPA